VVSERLVQRASSAIAASLRSSAACTTASGLPPSGVAENTLSWENGYESTLMPLNVVVSGGPARSSSDIALL
jgi:hypothetical protein